jgi:HD superfamily phosphodiesterase
MSFVIFPSFNVFEYFVSALHTPAEDSLHANSAIQHFHDKLLHIKDRLKTEPGKRMGAKRHGFVS